MNDSRPSIGPLMAATIRTAPAGLSEAMKEAAETGQLVYIGDHRARPFNPSPDGDGPKGGQPGTPALLAA